MGSEKKSRISGVPLYLYVWSMTARSSFIVHAQHWRQIVALAWLLQRDPPRVCSISIIKRCNNVGRDGETTKDDDIALNQVDQGKRQVFRQGRLSGGRSALCIVNGTITSHRCWDQNLLRGYSYRSYHLLADCRTIAHKFALRFHRQKSLFGTSF